MKITFVTDDFTTQTNGIVMSAYRFAKHLKDRGHEVKICAIGVNGPNMFSVEERKIPIVYYFSSKQNIHFAKPDKKVLEEAIKGSDIVHFFLPWKFAQQGAKIARRLGIATCAGFHLFPESITHNANFLRAIPFLNSMLYSSFKNHFYKYIENIHAPTKLVANVMKNHNYKSKIHIISNGVENDFIPLYDNDGKIVQPEPYNKIRILAVGRFAGEKRQDILIKAISMSKYKDKIELILAGMGPLKEKLEVMVEKLGINTVFGFYKKDELIKLIRQCTLYVHAADIETEAISCIEAFATGCVPIINNSKKSATTQFAIDDRSLYDCNNPVKLANKIDYLLDNEDERLILQKKYVEQAKFYRIDYSISRTEEMFKQCIADNKTKQLKRQEMTKATKKIKSKATNRNILKHAFGNVIYYGLACPLLLIFNKIKFGIKINGLKNLRKVKRTGAVSICNHVHEFDCTMVAMATFPRKPVFTTMPSNFKLPIAGQIVDFFGGVPVPTTIQENEIFFYELAKKINQGKIVHFYPEGSIVRYDEHLREFKRGAFRLAVIANAPILPMRVSFRKRKNPNLKPLVTITVGEPVYPDFKLFKRDAIEKLQKESEEAMIKLNLGAENKYV